VFAYGIAMKNYGTYLLLAIFTVVSISSCKKDNTTPPLSDPKFYYTGYTYNQSYQDANRQAIMCIGDSIVKLSPQIRSDAVALHVFGECLSTSGSKHNGANREVVYWTK